MPYVKRNAEGKIVELTSQEDSTHSEYLPATAPEIIAFLGVDPSQSETLQALRDSDGELARVIEDLIQVLIQKQVLLFTDLPDAVQQKLVSRQKLRSMLSQESTFLLSDDDMI